MSEIKTNVSELATQLKAQMELGANGVVTYKDPKTVYATTLGEDLTMDQVNALHTHRDNVIAAQGLAVGQLAMEAFKKDKGLTQLSVEMKAGKDVMSSSIAKEKEYNDGKGGKITNYGVLSTRYEANGAGKRGQLKVVRDSLMAQAKDIWS